MPQCADSSCVTRDSELNGNRVSTIIVPEMSFTCSGTVTHWRAAGVFRTGGNADTNSVLSIWRERSNEAGKYDRIGRIELGICGSENPAPSVSGVYECALATNMVLVQSGDIIGIELPSANSVKFQLHFYDTNSGPANYVFDSHNSPLSLSEATQRGQPQILLTVMPDSMPTTTTEATPTDPPTTTQDTTSTSTTSDPTTTRDDVTDPQPNVPATTTMSAEIPTSTGNVQNTQAPTMPMTNGPTTRDDVTDPQPPMTNSMATSTSIEQSTTTEATVSTMNTEPAIMGDSTTTLDSTITSTIPPSGDGGNRFVQPDSNSDANNIGPIAGAVVGSIIAVLLFLIIVLLLVLVLRRQNQNRKKFTPSNNATIVNPIYNGKPLFPILEDRFHFFNFLVMNI